MPCPHNEISIVQRSQQQSAVAAAAYQSGEKLFCEYDQEVKHYPEKRGIVHNEILLPANAPQKYADRNTLWNAAEAVEKQLCGGQEFTAKGKTILQTGWKQYSGDETVETPLPELAEGSTLPVDAASVKEGKTTPPKHYTEDICCERGIRNHP